MDHSRCRLSVLYRTKHEHNIHRFDLPEARSPVHFAEFPIGGAMIGLAKLAAEDMVECLQ